MALSDRLREKHAAVAARWLADALATYPQGATALFRRQADRFANPVGHALRVGTGAAVRALFEDRPPEEICLCLEEIIQMRAVQEFSPSQAVSFVFLLKDAIRAEFASVAGGDSAAAADPATADLAMLERRIDRVALGVFDVYLRYRTQVYQLRVNEAKRSVAALVDRINRRSPSPLPEADANLVQSAAANRPPTERGGDR